MPVPLDDLVGDRGGLETEQAAGFLFDVRVHVGEGAHRARQLPHAHRLAGPPEALQVATGLGVPERGLEAEDHGLGVDAVGAAHAQGVAMPARQRPEHRPVALEPGQQEVGGLLELQRERGVHHIRRREAHVDVPGVGPERLLQVRQEGDHVVAGGDFDLVDAGGLHPGPPLDPAERVFRDQTALGVHVAHRQLDLQPSLVLGVLGPDPRHLGPRVARDHGRLLRSASGRGGGGGGPPPPGSGARAAPRRARGG